MKKAHVLAVIAVLAVLAVVVVLVVDRPLSSRDDGVPTAACPSSAGTASSAPTRSAPASPVPRARATLTIGTLNWRGASHYYRNPRPRESPYQVRVPYMIKAIDSSRASIVGFQEFETVQATAFVRQTHGRWALVDGVVGGHADSRDAIAYRPAYWRPTKVRLVTIDYGVIDEKIPMARFVSKTDPRVVVWVLNTHNPANVVAGDHSIRAADVAAEVHAIKAVEAEDPATPVLFVGDMNESESFADQFLGLATGWSAANPVGSGQVGRGGHIDWVMGGPGVVFRHTVTDRTTNDGAHHYTDHPYVYSVAVLPGTATSVAGPTHPAVPRRTTAASSRSPAVSASPSATVRCRR